MLKLSNNSVTMDSSRRVTSNTNTMQKMMKRLSSVFRANSVSEDVVDLSVSESKQIKVRKVLLKLLR